MFHLGKLRRVFGTTKLPSREPGFSPSSLRPNQPRGRFHSTGAGFIHPSFSSTVAEHSSAPTQPVPTVLRSKVGKNTKKIVECKIIIFIYQQWESFLKILQFLTIFYFYAIIFFQ